MFVKVVFGDTDAERRNLLYINQGNLTFKEEAKEYGLDDDGYSSMLLFLIWIMIMIWMCIITAVPIHFILGYQKWFPAKEILRINVRNKLYRNDNGKFTEIGKQAGINQ